MSTVLTQTPRHPASTPWMMLLKAVWAVVLGLVSGLACVLLRFGFRMLQWTFIQHSGSLVAAASILTPSQRFFTPVFGALSATLVLWAAARWQRMESFEDYVAAVRTQDGHIPVSSPLWRTLSSAFSVATGAAVGREGSMIQFAAAITSWTAKHSGIRTPSLACQVSYGVAAAVAAAYAAPMAGVLFAFEIVLGEWIWSETLPLALSSCTGWLVARMLMGAGPLFAIHQPLVITREAAWGALLALLMAVLAPLYQKLMQSFHFVSRWPFALVWAGAVVGGRSLLKPEVWGNGDVALFESITRSSALTTIACLLAVRLIATSVCVGAGTIGGIFTPTLFAGAAVGLAAGQLFHAVQPILFAVIGMGAFLATVTQAPFMATMMTIELTGLWHLAPLLLLCNLPAWKLAEALGSEPLFSIATPDPDGRAGVDHAPA